MKENTLRVATFVALVIVMLANVVAARVNWQTYADRLLMQSATEDWKRQEQELRVRVERLEAAAQAKPPQQPQGQQ